MIKLIIYKLNLKRNLGLYFLLITIFLLMAVLLIILSTKISLRFNSETFEKIKPGEEVTVNHAFKADIFYNKESGSRVFTPEIVKIIRGAKKTIDLAIYSIDIPEVIQALKDQADQEILITLIIPDKKELEYRKVFTYKNINLIVLRDYKTDYEQLDGFIHHKFILIDADTNDEKLLFGSTNFTLLQEKYDAGYFFRTTDRELISVYKKELSFLKQGNFGERKLRLPTYKPFAKKINYSDGFIEVWLGPGFRENSIKYRMIELIKNAKREIKIMAWVFNDEQIAVEIVNKARAGIEVMIISDDSYIWTADSQIKNFYQYNLKADINNRIKLISDSFDNVNLLKKYINLDQDLALDFNPYLHYHSLIVDGEILVTGTNNWSANGFYHNDEDMIVTNIKTLVNSFENIFEFLYKKNKKNDLAFKLENINSGNDQKPYLTLDKSFASDSRVIFYRESAFRPQGIICFEGKITDNNIVTFPQKCLNERTIVYVTDDKYNLLASEYLYK